MDKETSNGLDNELNRPDEGIGEGSGENDSTDEDWEPRNSSLDYFSEESDTDFWEEASVQADEVEAQLSQVEIGREEQLQPFNLEDNELAYDSDIIVTPENSDQEDDDQPMRIYPRFNERVENDNPVLELSQLFTSAEAFKQALVNHSIANSYDFVWKFNQPKKMQAECKEKCGWKIYVSKVRGENTFQIKTYHPTHSCGGSSHKSSRINPKWICNKYMENMRDQPNLKTTSIRNDIQRKYGFDVNEYRIRRGKRMIKEKIYGINVEQFASLWSYADTVVLHNKGTTIKIQVDSTINSLSPRFERMYLCYEACKSGFLEGCRPFFGVDGCHLKGEDGGQLLSAISRDPNNGMFPLAVAWVEVENRDSWRWFLNLLKNDIGPCSNRGLWTIMSDRQKGLVAAIEDVFPDAEHRCCVRHIYSNIVSKGEKGLEIKELLWGAASVYDMWKHNRYMEELQRKYPNVHAYLDAIPRSSWCRSHFRTDCKMDLLVNNINESFNARILDARDTPVVTTFECIRRKLMREFQLKREAIERYNGRICPRIMKKMEIAKNNVRFCHLIYAGDYRYEVRLLNRTFITNIDSRQCSCGEWQVTGLPCSHGIAAIFKDKGMVENYIDDYYSVEAFKRAYKGVIYPIPSKEDWVPSTALPISPPLRKRQPGAPRKKRKRSAGEPMPNKMRKPATQSCRICKQDGHNKRTCPTRASSSKGPSHVSQADHSTTLPLEPVHQSRGGEEAVPGEEATVIEEESNQTKEPTEQEVEASRATPHVIPQIRTEANFAQVEAPRRAMVEVSDVYPVISSSKTGNFGYNQAKIKEMCARFTPMFRTFSAQSINRPSKLQPIRANGVVGSVSQPDLTSMEMNNLSQHSKGDGGLASQPVMTSIRIGKSYLSKKGDGGSSTDVPIIGICKSNVRPKDDGSSRSDRSFMHDTYTTIAKKRDKHVPENK